jgi:hypothetical protein
MNLLVVLCVKRGEGLVLIGTLDVVVLVVYLPALAVVVHAAVGRAVVTNFAVMLAVVVVFLLVVSMRAVVVLVEEKTDVVVVLEVDVSRKVTEPKVVAKSRVGKLVVMAGIVPVVFSTEAGLVNSAEGRVALTGKEVLSTLVVLTTASSVVRVTGRFRTPCSRISRSRPR